MKEFEKRLEELIEAKGIICAPGIPVQTHEEYVKKLESLKSSIMKEWKLMYHFLRRHGVIVENLTTCFICGYERGEHRAIDMACPVLPMGEYRGWRETCFKEEE